MRKIKSETEYIYVLYMIIIEIKTEEYIPIILLTQKVLVHIQLYVTRSKWDGL